MPAYHSMISYQCQALKCKKCTAWFPMRCGVFCGALLRPSLAFLLYNDSTVCLLLKFAVIPNLRAAFCEFFTMLSIISQVCANAQAQRQCLCARFMSCYAAYCALYRKVTTCARVQVSLGANLLLPTPEVMPFSTAHLTAL